MPFDAHKNLAVSLVATAPSPPTSGTTVVLTAGDGARFPAVPFNATVWPATQAPTPLTAEIVRVTGRVNDTLTITRAQEGTTARAIVSGDVFAATLSVKTITDLESGTNFPLITTDGDLTGANVKTGTVNSRTATDAGYLYVTGASSGVHPNNGAYIQLAGLAAASVPGSLTLVAGNTATGSIDAQTGSTQTLRQRVHYSGGISFNSATDPGAGVYAFYAPTHAKLVVNAAASSDVQQLWQRAGVPKWFNVIFGYSEDLQWLGADALVKLTLFQNGNLDAAGTVTMRSLGLKGAAGTVTLSADTLQAIQDRIAALETRVAALEPSPT